MRRDRCIMRVMKYVRITDEAHHEAKVAAAKAGMDLQDWASAAIEAVAREQSGQREERRQERRKAS